MTSEEINALDERTRMYIHDLESLCDPQGLIFDNWRITEENKGLRFFIEELKREYSIR